jgi:hypothetical protein
MKLEGTAPSALQRSGVTYAMRYLSSTPFALHSLLGGE